MKCATLGLIVFFIVGCETYANKPFMKSETIAQKGRLYRIIQHYRLCLHIQNTGISQQDCAFESESTAVSETVRRR